MVSRDTAVGLEAEDPFPNSRRSVATDGQIRALFVLFWFDAEVIPFVGVPLLEKTLCGPMARGCPGRHRPSDT